MGTFQAQLSKVTATGGQFALTHNVGYDMTDSDTAQPRQYAYPSDWNVNLVAELRQPLLQGAGVQFNRIAGPGATPGALQRRDARADQHRHRPGRLRGQRAKPGQRRGSGLLGAVLPVPQPRRGDRRPRQRLVDVAEDLHPLPQSAARAARPRKRPRPASNTTSSAARPSSRSTRCTPPKRSCAT